MNTRRSMSSQVRNSTEYLRSNYNIQLYKDNYLSNNDLTPTNKKDNDSFLFLQPTEIHVSKPKVDESINTQIKSEVNTAVFEMKNEIKIMINNFKKEIGDYSTLKNRIEIIEKNIEFSQVKNAKNFDKIVIENHNQLSNYKEENNKNYRYLEENIKIMFEENVSKIKEEIKELEEKNQREISKINKNMKEIEENLFKDIKKSNTDIAELTKQISEFQNKNISLINKYKNDLDLYNGKTNELSITNQFDVLSSNLLQNYVTNSLFASTKEKIEKEIKEILKTISSYKFVSQSEFDKLKKSIDIYQNNNNKEDNIRSNSIQHSTSYSNSSLLTEIQSKLEINEEIINEHQKIISMYNNKYIEKKDLKKYIIENILINDNMEELLSPKYKEINEKINNIEISLNDILTNKLPNIYTYYSAHHK